MRIDITNELIPLVEEVGGLIVQKQDKETYSSIGPIIVNCMMEGNFTDITFVNNILDYEPLIKKGIEVDNFDSIIRDKINRILDVCHQFTESLIEQNKQRGIEELEDPANEIRHIMKKYFPNYIKVMRNINGKNIIGWAIKLDLKPDDSKEEKIKKYGLNIAAQIIIEMIDSTDFKDLDFKSQCELVENIIEESYKRAEPILKKHEDVEIPEEFVKLLSFVKKKDIDRFIHKVKLNKSIVFQAIHSCSKMGFQHKMGIFDKDEDKTIITGILTSNKSNIEPALNNYSETRKKLTYHFFFKDSVWHCFYWQIQDVRGDHGKHWDHHIHYNSSFIEPISMSEFESKLKNNTYSNKNHVDFDPN